MPPSSIFEPFSPYASIDAAIAASRSGASHMAWTWGPSIVARPGAHDMSVTEQHATTASTRSGARAAAASA